MRVFQALYHESTIRVSQARYATPRAIIYQKTEAEFFNATLITTDGFHSAQRRV